MPEPRRYFNLAILAVTFPMLSLADLTGTATLAADAALNLDTGASGASGGDLLWNGSTLSFQGSATGFVLPDSGTAAYGSLTLSQLTQFSPLFGKTPISYNFLLNTGLIIGIHTNGGNYAKLLVTGVSGGSLGLQYTTFGASAGTSVTSVENAATNIPPGLPNSGIAQGSLFVIKGSNLGPETYTQALAFPLPSSVGGTSITVTVNGTTVNAIMFYSLARQVAAILPSKTPTGTGTITLNYNGQTATAQITVVQNSIGVYTVSQTGTGDAIAFLNSDSQLITPTHAANPGDVVIFWGTGLGPVTFDESQPAIQTDMTGVPLEVYIGGQQAEVNFRGRNGCCSSADTIYVTVPSGTSGCAVPVLMQVGNMVGNATSIAVAGNGRTCTPVNGSSTLTSMGTHTFGTLSISRQANTSTGISGSPTIITQDLAGGNLEDTPTRHRLWVRKSIRPPMVPAVSRVMQSARRPRRAPARSHIWMQEHHFCWPAHSETKACPDLLSAMRLSTQPLWIKRVARSLRGRIPSREAAAPTWARSWRTTRWVSRSHGLTSRASAV